MSSTTVNDIARAVLYEGYMLYPYRRSVKNTQRWTFGGIFPRDYGQAAGGADPVMMQAQCLLAGPRARVSISLRFLHLIDRSIERAPEFERVQCLRMGGIDLQSWQEAIEREVRLDAVPLVELTGQPRLRQFSFPGSRQVETLADEGRIAGRLVREQQPISGLIELSCGHAAGDLTELTVRILNLTAIAAPADREQALLASFASTHIILLAEEGRFISLTDPPASMAELASRCQNVGCWPVLAGEQGDDDTLLVSPIILPDYPRIAPESPGDLFDGCEIDEILTLRILTMTDEEKRQAASTDERVRQLLERTQTLARQQLMSLHGAVRGLRPVPEARQHG